MANTEQQRSRLRRIPDKELEDLKREVDLAALVRSKGIELKPHGSKDLVGLSPFSDEKTPSFIVTPAKNLWHCMSSGQGGSVIDFVMQHEGVSFRHAVLLLKEQSPQVLGGQPARKARAPKLAAPVAFDADDQTLFQQVLDYYQERLRANPAALNYLASRGLQSEAALKSFRIGYADRTLGLRLPDKSCKDGQDIRQRLTKIGLYRESGHEHFNGCLVFPICDEKGLVTEIYGRKANEKQKNKIYHLYLPGPHKGIWNPACLQSPAIILTESVIDALTFWVNGFHNVTCIYGTEGFIPEHLKAFNAQQTQKVYLAYDRDKAGERAAERDASRLGSVGIDCFRIRFPSGMDANEYALKVTPAEQSLSALVQSADPLNKGQSASSSNNNLAAKVSCSADGEAAKEKKNEEEALTKALPAEPDNGVKLPQLELVGEDYVIAIADRQYRVRGLAKNGSLESLKVNLRLSVGDRFHLDTLDFYRAKDRESFIRAAASETMIDPDWIKCDLGKLLVALESLQEKRISEALEPKHEDIAIAANEKKEALALLQSPHLLKQILSDFDTCGIVGEATNKLTGYLAAVSRKLDKPLAIIVQSTSAAGKTALMESVLAMMPEEERVKYSAMTGQSLYYLGETNLKNKILAIVEEEGAEKASYALKLLQSEGELTIASTGKDEQGRMKTEEYHVEGPVMIFLTTTAVDIDEELLNRCLILTVDESREQTKAIHNLQRESETFEGLKRKTKRSRILTIHRNAQRLLKPLHVVNPYAKQLTFLSDRTRTRRDHMKYLTLIRTITLLHQHQRPLKEKDGLHYIEVTLKDINAANTLAHEVLGRSLDELPPQTRRLLILLKQMVTQLCQKKAMRQDDCLFTRRQVRDFTGWSNTQLKVHLDRLDDLEYILPHRGMRGIAYRYELIFDGDTETEKPQLIGLIDTQKLEYDAKIAGQNETFTASKRGQNGGFADSSIAGESSNKAAHSPSTPKSPNAQAVPNKASILS